MNIEHMNTTTNNTKVIQRDRDRNQEKKKTKECEFATESKKKQTNNASPINIL